MRDVLVYVAGPISKGDLLDNVRRAHEAGMSLLKAGLSAIVPHGSCFWGHTVTPCGKGLAAELSPHGTTHADWLGVDLEIVRRCDAVLRLPGESKGADLEVGQALRLGLPVFFSVEEVISWVKWRSRLP